MDVTTFLITNLLNGLIGVVLLLGGYKIFDLITPKWNFQQVFKEKGISGGAIIVSAFLIALAMVISSTAF